MSIADELEQARRLACADDEMAAKEILLGVLSRVDSDDDCLEALAQLGELYLVRTAYDGVREAVRRIRECLAIYVSILNETAPPEIVAQNTLTTTQARHLVARYSSRAQCLEVGLAAAIGDHDGAAAALDGLDRLDQRNRDLAEEHAYLTTYARTLCAEALGEDDLHVRAKPLWERVIEDIGRPHDSELADRLWVNAALGYARFCLETGRRAEAEPWLRRTGARAEARGWPLVTARTQLERAVANWSTGDYAQTEQLVTTAYPVIAHYLRANDVARCWLYLGLTRLAAGGLQAAHECWAHAEVQWRDLGRPLHLHRILVQRSWIPIMRGQYAAALALVEQARECLDSWPRSSWLAYARLDDHLGTIWRADGLADLGFDGAGDPEDDWAQAEGRYRHSAGVINRHTGADQQRSGLAKLGLAAELKVPAALAVDSVRYSIADAGARSLWANAISGRILAGAFAVASEAEDTALLGELIEYHSARGTLSPDDFGDGGLDFASGASPAPIVDPASYALVADGPATGSSRSLTRLGPLPPLQMDPTGGPILARFRDLAVQRYGQSVTADEVTWSTWP